jgi:hypothetical protein
MLAPSHGRRVARIGCAYAENFVEFRLLDHLVGLFLKGGVYVRCVSRLPGSVEAWLGTAGIAERNAKSGLWRPE